MLTVTTNCPIYSEKLQDSGWVFVRLVGNELTWMWPHKHWPSEPQHRSL